MNVIPGFPGYWALEDGRIWSDKSGRFLKLSPNPDGYLTVGLGGALPRRTHTVHKLIALAFHGHGRPGEEVRHLNGQPDDNHVPNLKWGTRGENRLDSVIHGTHHNARKTHCKRNHEFTPENTRVSADGAKRRCRTCGNLKLRERRRAKAVHQG